MRFDFTDLNLFRHIVEAGSITHGAARSNLALAAASTRIRKMEQAFGTTLLVRGRQGVVPTQAGRTLLQHTRMILAQSERMQEDLTPYARGLAGQVRVLSNTNALTEFLPETLSSFLTTYPDISVDLEERLSDEIVGLIAEGAADIGIVAGTVDYGGLHTFPFRSDRFVLVVARNHPLASRSRIGFAEVLLKKSFGDLNERQTKFVSISYCLMKYLSRVKYSRQSMCFGSSPRTYSRCPANSTAKRAPT